MKTIEKLKQHSILLLIALFSSVGLFMLSYLTVLSYNVTNLENYIRVVDDGLTEALEGAVRLGLHLERYPDTEKLLASAAELFPEGTIVVLEDEKGEVLASSIGEGSSFPLDRYRCLKQEITEQNEILAGALVYYYPKAVIREEIGKAAERSLIASVLCYLILLLFCARLAAQPSSSGRRWVSLIVAAISIQGIILVLIYLPSFEEAAYRNVEGVSNYVGRTINDLIEKGVTPEDISDLDAYLEEKASDNDSIESIEIRDKKEARKGENGEIGTGDITKRLAASASYLGAINYPLKDTTRPQMLTVRVSIAYIQNSILYMILMFVATIFLAVIVLHESLALPALVFFRQSPDFRSGTGDCYVHIAKALRYGTFLAIIFDYICMPFSAWVIRDWGRGCFGLSVDDAAALSVAVCPVACMVGIMIMPAIGRKVPGKRLMEVSAAGVIVADAIGFLTGSPLVLILTRFLAGLGQAGISHVRYIQIAEGYSSEEEHKANLVESNNGVIGGVICGMGLGSVLMEVFGCKSTFMAACVVGVLYLLFELFFIPWELFEAKRLNAPMQGREGANLGMRTFRLFKTSAMWRQLILVVTPQYMLLMIMVSLVPARLQSLGLSAVFFAYSNLFYGVAGLYVGESLNRLLHGRLRVIQIYGVMLVCGAASLFMLESPTFAGGFILLASALLGIIDGVGLPAATELFTGEKEWANILDETEGLVLFTVLGNLVMTAAPFVFARCEKSVLWMNGTCVTVLIAALVVFARAARKSRKMSE